MQADVTTEDDGQDLTGWGTRAAIGGTSCEVLGPRACGWGGFAYVGSFGSRRLQPAFVFSYSLGKGTPKFVQEAVSHELGHMMGLG